MAIHTSNREILTVSDLNKSAKRLLEGEFPMIFVEGEISNFSTPASGHWYFTLKDSKAQLRSAMFRGSNRKIRFVPRNGLQVVVRGRISLYEGRGEFQMIAEFIEEAGDGALRRAYETLKNQLETEGLFSADLKKQLPTLPKHLAIITSPTGAAIRDVLQILKRRFPAMAVSIIPVQVQGEESIQQIVEALSLANRPFANLYGDFDAILLTRGGGSLEDLWSFNTEPVARAIAASSIPVISAIGHETDTTIADFVADFRAPTPSAAAEILSPDSESWMRHFLQIENSLHRYASQLQERLSSNLVHLRRRLRHPGQRIQDWYQRLDDLEARLASSYRHYLANLNFDNLELRLKSAMNQTISTAKHRLNAQSKAADPSRLLAEIHTQSLVVNHLSQSLIHQSKLASSSAAHRLGSLSVRLDSVSPLGTLSRGYAIVTKDEKVIKNTGVLKLGDKVETRLSRGGFKSEIIEIEES
ncbi:MAG: exodeoxyribonuclease VII large subunit [Pseudomonadales bacterium]|nr:exodeoxyribonuclease VII large subunit [Pseudomonadales bacterium]